MSQRKQPSPSRRRQLLTAALTVAFAVVAISTASTQASADQGLSDSFAGTCSLHGTGHFSPALTPTPGPTTLVNHSTGTCSGTLDGTPLASAPVTLSWLVHVYADGCLAAHTTAPGPGTITFPGGVSIAFTADFSGVLTEYPLTIHGQRSSTAHGLANLFTAQTSPLVALQCAGLNGGLSQTPVDVTISTDTPLVNGDPPPPAPSFSGTCHLSGTVAFNPFLSTAVQHGQVNVSTSGTCSGMLTNPIGNNQQIAAQAATVTATSQGIESCELGAGTGTGYLALAGQEIRFTYTEIRTGPALVLTAAGSQNG